MIVVTPCEKSVAAVVTGVDFLNGVDDETFAAVRRAWEKYPVLVFRGQEIGIDAQQAFSAKFGTLKSRRFQVKNEPGRVDDNPYVLLVSNIRENGRLIGTSPKGALSFHSDSAFDERPAMASLLYGIELPSVGGDTLFISMYDVYDRLPEETKRFIADKWALNYHLPTLAVDPSQTEEERFRSAPRFAHPMVIRHPDSGRPVLFVNRHMTRSIIGLPKEESDALLESLYLRTEDPAERYDHKWQKHDLVLWDNRAVQHGRSDFSPNERRLLRRFAVFCDVPPVAFSPNCGPRPAFTPAVKAG